jgi:hypothetical protein
MAATYTCNAAEQGNEFLAVLMESMKAGGGRGESELDFQPRLCFIMLRLSDNHWHRSGTVRRAGAGNGGVPE